MAIKNNIYFICCLLFFQISFYNFQKGARRTYSQAGIEYYCKKFVLFSRTLFKFCTLLFSLYTIVTTLSCNKKKKNNNFSQGFLCPYAKW